MTPTATHPTNALAGSASKLCAFERASICLVDDDPSMLKALDRLLTSEGFKVKKFSDPASFLETIGQMPCLVAILDVWMPELNGLEVQSALRKDWPEIRIIFVSGRDEPSVREAALEAGAFGFLSKPFDDEALLELVRKAAAA